MTDRVRVSHPAGGRVLVKQSDAVGVDINAIVRRARAAGGLPPGSGRTPGYGDFTGVASFQDALNRVRQAEDDFFALPARVRQACENDPGKFLEFVFDPERRAELVALGLAEAAIPEAVKPAPAPEKPADGQLEPDAEP